VSGGRRAVAGQDESFSKSHVMAIIQHYPKFSAYSYVHGHVTLTAYPSPLTV
jgi:hypothetical protein